MKITESYNVQIWVGSRVGYTEKIHQITEVEKICDEFVNEIQACVTITQTQFRYVNGDEPGVMVGIINYPRFPSTQDELLGKAINLATRLMCGLEQKRVSITTPDKTYMLEDVDCIQKGDKVIPFETIRNTFGQPLFEKGITYEVLDVDGDYVTIDHILYANEPMPHKIDWVIRNFKIIKE